MRRGFTLIELLVVVAIIALLLAIGGPAMTRALALTNINRCASNMHQFAIANTAYSTHNNGRFPGPNWRRANAKGWLYSNLQMDALEHLKTGLLWDYLMSYDVYRCPIDQTDPATVPNRPNNTRMITSYCMNGSVCGYGAKPYDGGTGYWETYKMMDFRPTDIIMWEPDETKSGGWWWDGANFPWEGITVRHVDRGMTTCADGHAEWLLHDEYYDISPRNPSKPTRLWNRPGSNTGR